MADEKLNTGPAENKFPEAAEPITTPEQAAALNPSRNRPGLPYLSPAMWLCPLTKSMSLWLKRDRTPAPKSKRRKPPKRRRRQPPEKHRSPLDGGTEKAAPWPSAESGKGATENQKAEKSAGARKGRPPKADKAAPDKPKPSKRDKVSRSDGKAPDAKEPLKPPDTAPKETAAAPEQTAPLSQPHRPARLRKESWFI